MNKLDICFPKKYLLFVGFFRGDFESLRGCFVSLPGTFFWRHGGGDTGFYFNSSGLSPQFNTCKRTQRLTFFLFSCFSSTEHVPYA